MFRLSSLRRLANTRLFSVPTTFPKPDPFAKFSFPETKNHIASRIEGRNTASKFALYSLIRTCPQETDLTTVEDALKYYRNNRLTVTYKTSSQLVQKYLSFKAVDRLLPILKDKKTFGIFPSQKTYHSVMFELLQQSRYKDVLDVFHQCLIDDSGSLQPKTLEFAVKACCLEGSRQLFDRALLYCETAEEDQVTLTERTYALLFTAALKHEDVIKAREIQVKMHDLFSPDSRVATILHARMQLALGNIEQSLSYLELAVDMKPDQPLQLETSTSFLRVLETNDAKLISRFEAIKSKCEGWSFPSPSPSPVSSATLSQ